MADATGRFGIDPPRSAGGSGGSPRFIGAEIAAMIDQRLQGDSTDTLFGDCAGLRMRPDFVSDGYQDLLRISDDLTLCVSNFTRNCASHAVYGGEDLLKIHVQLAGHIQVGLPGADLLDFADGVCGVMLHPAGMPKQEWAPAEGHVKSVTLFCRPSLLEQRLGSHKGMLPQTFERFLDGKTFDLLNTRVALTADMVHAVRNLLDSGMTGSLRLLQAEAKAFELLCHVVDGMTSNQAAAVAPALSRAEQDRVRQARDILSVRISAPPTLEQLARLVGLNRNKLAHGFRQTFGMSVVAFCVQARMEFARALLRDTDLPIGLVAERVGYEYAANFTLAFKRHFGVTPKQDRNRPAVYRA